MTTAAATHDFTAKINGKGQTPSGVDFLQLNWMLPDSKFPCQLYLGRDPEVYDAWNVGDTTTVTIIRC